MHAVFSTLSPRSWSFSKVWMKTAGLSSLTFSTQMSSLSSTIFGLNVKHLGEPGKRKSSDLSVADYLCFYLMSSSAVSFMSLCCLSCMFPSVCISLYELATGLPKSEMPYHFYTDQRFALLLLCVFLILPMSISKEISIQKYIRLGIWFSSYITKTLLSLLCVLKVLDSEVLRI